MPPKKRQLVASAIQCFAESGFAATSTRSIAQRADVAEATIFRHFKTKQELLLRIASPVLKILLAPAAANEAAELLEQSNSDFRAFLRSIMISRLTFADKYKPFILILVHEMPVNAELRALVSSSMHNVLGEVLTKAFKHFEQSGQIIKVDSHRTIRYFASLLAGYYMQRTFLQGTPADDLGEIDAMIEFIFHGISNQPRS